MQTSPVSPHVATQQFATPSAHNADQYVVPGWFARMTGGVLLLVLPWAGWMTILVSELNVKMGMLTETAAHAISVDRRVTTLEQQVKHLEEGLIRLDARKP